jgi:hypothetical protein
MKKINKYIKENIIKESENIAEKFIQDINIFVDSKIANLSTFDHSYIDNDDNSLYIRLESKDGYDTYDINIYGIDNKNNYGYEFDYLPQRTKNVFIVSFQHTTLNSSGVGDELYEFIKKKDQKLAKSFKPYNGFERGGWDEEFETIYPINDITIKYLKDCLIEYCKKIK